MAEYEVTLFEQVMRKIIVEAKDERDARFEAGEQIPRSYVHHVELKDEKD